MSETTSRGYAEDKATGHRSIKMGEVGILCPDERKFEKEIAHFTKTIKELEGKIKPISTNATQVIAAEITKETGQLTDIDKAKGKNTSEVKALEASIREIGTKVIEKKKVASDLLAGVRHKTESGHDDAVGRLKHQLEHQMLLKRCSSSEERKFKQEIEVLTKSKERLVVYLAAKSEIDHLREEQENLRSQRDSLYRKGKDLRVKEMATKDRIAHLKQELEEAKEQKKVSITEKDQIKTEIDSLYQQRKQLYDQFRSQQLAFNAQLKQKREEERQKRDESRAARAVKKKYKAIEQGLQREQRYSEHITACNALISHLKKLQISQPGATANAEEDTTPAPLATNLDPVPLRSESAPIVKPGKYILRREKDEVLVPAASSLTRKRSKKEKRRNVLMSKVSRRLNLNAAIFEQFGILELAPPSTFSDIPRVLSSLNDKLAYFENKPNHMTFLSEVIDSGVGSTAPSEFMDTIDPDIEFTNSQEEMNLDPGLGSNNLSPKASQVETSLLPQCSASDTTLTEKDSLPKDLTSISDQTLDHGGDPVSPDLITMTSSSTGASGQCHQK